MSHNKPNKPNRRTIRLQEYDYTQNGAYFVTICVQRRIPLFGDIVEGKMVLNQVGEMVERVWNQIPDHYEEYYVEAVQVMPNHLHGILLLMDDGFEPRAREDGRTRGSAPTGRLSLGGVIQRYKTMTMRRYSDGVTEWGWRQYSGRLWQRNYWEHIIRNERELYAYKEYIENNPLQWHYDTLHPRRDTKSL